MYNLNANIVGRSPLAVEWHDMTKARPERWITPFGVCVHTTGACLDAATKHHVSQFEYVLAYYLDPDSYSPHYVIDLDGTIVQVSDEHEKAAHIGLTPEQHDLYMSGDWVKKVSKVGVDLWKERWPTSKSPAHLYPGYSPNNAYIGIELVPVEPDPPTPRWRYTWPQFHSTWPQFHSLAQLLGDIAKRWSFPYGWWKTGRLVGHEDVAPLDRWNSGGGWDPGALRTTSWFPWSVIRDELTKATPTPAETGK